MPIKLIALIGFVFIVGCSSSSEPESQNPPAPLKNPAASQEIKMPVVTTPSNGLWVTFDVNQELFRVVVTNENAVNAVLDFLAGKRDPQIPMGVVQTGGEFNQPWSWHLDPDSIQFVDMATEICDGRPSDIENDLTGWINSVKRYCPWRAKIVEVKDCRSNQCNTIFPMLSQ